MLFTVSAAFRSPCVIHVLLRLDAMCAVVAVQYSLTPRVLTQGDLKDSVAAEALSHLAQGFPPVAHPGQFPHGMLPTQLPLQHNPMAGEPGPSSHPRGPPNLGQLSAVATALQANAQQLPPPPDGHPPSQDGGAPPNGGPPTDDDSPDASEKPTSAKGSGRRGGRSSTMSNDEWARIRKDNHVRFSVQSPLHLSSP